MRSAFASRRHFSSFIYIQVGRKDGKTSEPHDEGNGGEGNAVLPRFYTRDSATPGGMFIQEAHVGKDIPERAKRGDTQPIHPLRPQRKRRGNEKVILSATIHTPCRYLPRFHLFLFFLFSFLSLFFTASRIRARIAVNYPLPFFSPSTPFVSILSTRSFSYPIIPTTLWMF